MQFTKVTKPRTVTYLDARAEVTEYRVAGPMSERVVATRWIDQAHERNGGHAPGTITLVHVKGDGRKPATFVKFGSHVLEPGTDVTEYVRGM